MSNRTQTAFVLGVVLAWCATAQGTAMHFPYEQELHIGQVAQIIVSRASAADPTVLTVAAVAPVELTDQQRTRLISMLEHAAADRDAP